MKLAQKLKGEFPNLIGEPTEFRGEVSVVVGDLDRVAEVCAFAKRQLGFNYLVDISSLDNYGEDPRFTLVYHLYGYEHRQYLRLRGTVSEEKGEVPTVTGVWRAADWHEREIYDMMGVKFRGHPDLRRILMWEGYPYFPLRKDFPVSGKPTHLPEVAFTDTAPLAGGPFVTVPGAKDAVSREPRVRLPEEESATPSAQVERVPILRKVQEGRTQPPGKRPG